MEYRRPGFIARLSAPLRGTGQRFVLTSLVIAGFGFMVLGSSGAGVVERLRTAVTDVTAPILEALAEPVSAFNGAIARIGELASLRSENARLREEVERLRAWQGVAHRLAAENAALRDMVGYRGPRRHAFISARVIADARGPFVRSVLVNVGSRDGVAKGQGALTPAGLVGRVIEVGTRSARVLILTDLNSRVPVVIEDTRRVRAILAGDNSALPRLAFLPSWAEVEAGQRVVTSGHGGILPPGLPVGRVIAGDGGVRVRPFVDPNQVEYLQIVDFQPVEAPAATGQGQGISAGGE